LKATVNMAVDFGIWWPGRRAGLPAGTAPTPALSAWSPAVRAQTPGVGMLGIDRDRPRHASAGQLVLDPDGSEQAICEAWRTTALHCGTRGTTARDRVLVTPDARLPYRRARGIHMTGRDMRSAMTVRFVMPWRSTGTRAGSSPAWIAPRCRRTAHAVNRAERQGDM